MVSEGGGIANIKGASNATVASERSSPSTPSREEPTDLSPPSKLVQVPATSSEEAGQSLRVYAVNYLKLSHLSDDPCLYAFSPSSMEAIATAFALDIPSVGMLVLPSDAPIHQAVHDLRLLR